MTLPVVKREELTKAHFERYPVWGLFGEYEDLLTPITQTDPIPREAPAEFIKADFYSPSGLHFEGYIVNDAHAIHLFVGEADLAFNVRLPDLAQQTLLRLLPDLGSEDLRIFPLIYRTSYRFEGEDLISGSFDPFATS